MDFKTLAISVVAGAACVLLISAGNSSAGALPLFLLAPMPIYVAAFGWGTNAAIIAAIAAIAGAGIAVTTNSAIVTALVFALPAAIIGYQANLAQENSQGDLEWFPLPRLFFNLSVVVSSGLLCMLVYFGYHETKIAALPILTDVINQVKAQNPVFDQFSEEEFELLKESTFNMMPFWISGIWLIVHAVNISLSAFVCRASGLMPRPKDDIARTIRLPIVAIATLAASIVLSAMSVTGEMQYYAGAYLGVFLTAFSLIGLAMLHERARKSGPHFILLMLSYALILFIYLPMFVFAGAGIVRTFLRPNSPPAISGGPKT